MLFFVYFSNFSFLFLRGFTKSKSAIIRPVRGPIDLSDFVYDF